VKRNSPWNSTYKLLNNYFTYEPQKIRKFVHNPIVIEFEKEIGVDYDGLTKEWLTLLG